LSGHASRGSQWLQIAIGLSITVAIAGGIYYEVTATPEDTLYIKLGQLRSRAAEVTRVADGAAAQRLTAHYIEAQSQQLAKAVAKLRDELAKAQASAGSPDAASVDSTSLRASRFGTDSRLGAARRAHALSETLLALTQSLAQNGESPPEAAALRDRARAIVDALIPIERAARPS